MPGLAVATHTPKKLVSATVRKLVTEVSLIGPKISMRRGCASSGGGGSRGAASDRRFGRNGAFDELVGGRVTRRMGCQCG